MISDSSRTVGSYGPSGGANFSAANIYSLVAGAYPILTDGTGRPDVGFSSNTSGIQATQQAPIVWYNHAHYTYDAHVGERGARQPLLHGNKIIYSELNNYASLGEVYTDQEEQELVTRTRPLLTNIAQSVMWRAQEHITGNIVTAAAEQQAEVNTSAKSMEEMAQSGSPVVSTPQRQGEDLIGGQAFDFFDPLRRVHVNATNQNIQAMGHGIYGSGARRLHSHIDRINDAFNQGILTEEQRYDQIVQEGVDYYTNRMNNTWNPIIRHARNLVDSQNNPYRSNRGMGKTSNWSSQGTRNVEMRVTVSDFATNASQFLSTVGTTGMTNYASESARDMLKQHLGSYNAMYNGGLFENLVIDNFTFAEFGRFAMFAPGSPNEYEYDISKFNESRWMQNYFATSDAVSLSNVAYDAERDARLRHAAWVANVHQAENNAAAIGGSGTVAMGGLTAQAMRLYPEINLHNANEQLSDAIHNIVGNIRSLADLHQNSPELYNIVRQHQLRFTYAGLNTNELHIWTGPYLSFYDQSSTSGIR